MWLDSKAVNCPQKWGNFKDPVYRWIDHKGLPAHKIGRLWKFKLSEVDDWVRDGGASGDEPGQDGKGRRG